MQENSSNNPDTPEKEQQVGNEALTTPGEPTPETNVPSGLELDVDVGQYLPEYLQPGWYFVQSFPLLMALLLIALGYGLGKALQSLVVKTFSKATSKTETDLDDKFVRFLSAPLVVTSVVLALIVVVLTLNLPPYPSKILIRILVSVLLFFWGRAWFKATHLALEAMSSSNRFGVFQPRTVPLFEMGIKVVLLGLIIYMFMGIWGIDATAWLASAGIIGIAVGFGARDTLANLISGVSIIADAPYKLGDFIVLDTGERGMVTHLGIRSTRLLTRDDVEVSIPNAVIGNAKITNESGGPWVKHRIRMKVGVAYGSDTGKVVRLLEQVAAENDFISKNPAPRVRMRAFGANSLDFELMGWIDRPENRGLVTHQVLMEIDRRFREEGIEIPFPQQDVHLKSGSLLPVETTDAEEGES
jgi:small-conductance mechanosensitive channel